MTSPAPIDPSNSVTKRATQDGKLNRPASQARTDINKPRYQLGSMAEISQVASGNNFYSIGRQTGTVGPEVSTTGTRCFPVARQAFQRSLAEPAPFDVICVRQLRDLRSQPPGDELVARQVSLRADKQLFKLLPNLSRSGRRW